DGQNTLAIALLEEDDTIVSDVRWRASGGADPPHIAVLRHSNDEVVDRDGNHRVLLTASTACERDAQLCCDSAPQAAARPLQSRLPRPSRHAGERGDLPSPEAINVVELHCLLLFCWQLRERLPHEIVELARFLSRIRGRFCIHPDEAANRLAAGPIL